MDSKTATLPTFHLFLINFEQFVSRTFPGIATERFKKKSIFKATLEAVFYLNLRWP
jgi:hypothetical protein